MKAYSPLRLHVQLRHRGFGFVDIHIGSNSCTVILPVQVSFYSHGSAQQQIQENNPQVMKKPIVILFFYNYECWKECCRILFHHKYFLFLTIGLFSWCFSKWGNVNPISHVLFSIKCYCNTFTCNLLLLNARLLLFQLLPDMNYASNMTYLCVYNGPHMLNHKDWDLKKFIQRRRKLENDDWRSK